MKYDRKKKLKSKLSIFCILSHYLISMIWNHSLLSYYPHGVGAGVTENRAGRKLLFWRKKPLKKSVVKKRKEGRVEEIIWIRIN